MKYRVRLTTTLLQSLLPAVLWATCLPGCTLSTSAKAEESADLLKRIVEAGRDCDRARLQGLFDEAVALETAPADFYQRAAAAARYRGFGGHAAQLLSAGFDQHGDSRSLDSEAARALAWTVAYTRIDAKLYNEAEALAERVEAASDGARNTAQALEFAYSMADPDVLQRAENAISRFDGRADDDVLAQMHRIKALAYLDEDNAAAARAAVERAESLDPDNADVLLVFAQTLYREAMNTEFKRYYDEGRMQFGPMVPLMREAQAKLDRAIAANREDPLVDSGYLWQEKARIYIGMRDPENTVNALLHALAINPEDSITRRMLGSVLARLGRQEDLVALNSGDFTVIRDDGDCVVLLHPPR